MAEYKGIRVMLTLDKRIHELLEQWATSNRLPLASFAKSILEKEVLAAEARGDCGVGNIVVDAAAYIAYTRAIAGLGHIDPLELQRLADTLGVDSTVLAKALNGWKNHADKI